MTFIFGLIECICALVGLGISIGSIRKSKRTEKTTDARQNIQCGKINDSYIEQINMEGFGGSSNEEFLKLVNEVRSESAIDGLIRELY